MGAGLINDNYADGENLMVEMLKDKVAIVTGSGRGIGRGVAKLMAAQGAKVVVVDPGVNAVSYTHLTLPTNREV